jgi:hypothetical protein
VRAVFGTLAALVAIGLAGCGGGGRSSHGTFVDDAASICRSANMKFAEIDIARPNAARAAAALESVVTIGSDALLSLRELKPPVKDQTDVSAWLGTLEQALDEVQYMRDLLAQDRVGQAIDAALRADLLTTRAGTLARKVGLDRVCRVPRLIPTPDAAHLMRRA